MATSTTAQSESPLSRAFERGASPEPRRRVLHLQPLAITEFLSEEDELVALCSPSATWGCDAVLFDAQRPPRAARSMSSATAAGLDS